MYVTEEYNPQGDGGNLQFSVKINVYGKDGLSIKDRMMRTSGSEDFHSSEYKSKITSIVTKGDAEIPEGVIESWDISEKQNGSVIAYIEDDGTGAGTYKVTIGAQDKIIANYDMSNYFDGFTNCTSIDLSNLDTNLTTNMSAMFGSFLFITGQNNKSLETIIFGGYYDTSNVTDMPQMFQGCRNLLELDLRNFDTYKVTSYDTMFSDMTNITEILVTRDKWTIPNSTITNSGVTDFTYV